MVYFSTTEFPLKEWLQRGAIVDLLSNQVLISLDQDGSLKPRHSNNRGFYRADYWMTEISGWQQCPFGSLVVSRQELLEALEEFPEEQTVERSWVEPEFSDFSQTYNTIQTAITNGVYQKAVPTVTARSKQGGLTINERAKALCSLLKGTNAVYGFWNKEAGVLGATPECLWLRKGNRLETRALAGTYRTDQGSDEDFLRDPKEASEHQFVVSALKERFQSFGDIKVGETAVIGTLNLRHLQTPITVQLKSSIDTSKLIIEMHPTPALGLSPKREDWVRHMREISYPERRYFGAPIGGRAEDTESVWVMIRGVEWNAETLFLPAGCGIVAASDVEKEWHELAMKRVYTLRQLGWEA